MAAPVVTQSGDGSQNIRETPAGVSYANAVLNFKNTDNKENFHSTVTHASKENHPTREVPIRNKTNGQRHYRHNHSHHNGASEEFPRMKNARKYEKSEPNPARPPRNNSNVEPAVNGTCQPVEIKHDADENITLDDNAVDTGKEKEVEEDSKPKYVAAPLPKVNPWAVKNTAPQPMEGPDTPPDTISAVVVTTVTADKRVLQPQQQTHGIIGKLWKIAY